MILAKNFHRLVRRRSPVPVELRQPLARRLKGVLFMDVGDAWGGNYSNVNLEGFTQTVLSTIPSGRGYHSTGSEPTTVFM